MEAARASGSVSTTDQEMTMRLITRDPIDMECERIGRPTASLSELQSQT